MKRRSQRHRSRARVLVPWASAALLIGTPWARGANLTWDSSGTTPAAPTDGGGTWSTVNANWSNGVGDVVWDNLSTAVLGTNTAAAGIVTINDAANTVTAAGVTFNKPLSGSYEIAASGVNRLTLSGLNPIITTASTVSATISAPIAGVFNNYLPGGTTQTGLLLNGTGSLTLSGVSTYTGSTIISSNGAGNTGTAVTLSGSLGSSTSNVFVGFTPTAGQTDSSSLTMTNTATLTAATLVVGYNFSQGQVSTTLPATLNVNGTNTINADTILITAGRNSGNTKGGFGLLKLGSGATLSLHDAANDGNPVALLDIANYKFETGGGTGTGTAGTVDFSAGTVNGTITEVDIATGKPGSGNGAGTSAGAFLFSNGTLNIITLNLARRAQSGINQAANGTLTLVAGGTGTITAGTITFGTSATGTVTGATGTININGPTLRVAGDVTNNPTGGGTPANATINLAGGTLDMGGGTATPHNLGSASAAVTLNATSGTLRDVLSINGTGGLTMSGPGTLTLQGTNSYSGATTVNGGTLLVGAAAAMGAGGALVVNGGTLDLNGFSQTVASLAGTNAAGVITNNGVASPVTLTVGGGDTSYAGVVKDGTSNVSLSVTIGTLALTSATASTYTGATTVAPGATLRVTSINSATALNVMGTMNAAGTVGSILVDTGGSFTPGPAVSSNTTGTLSGSSLTIGSGGGALSFLANSALAIDKLTLSGAATLNGGLGVNVTLSGAMPSGTYDLLTSSGLALNGNPVNPTVTVGGGGATRVSGSVIETATKIQLVVSGNPASLTWTGTADTTSWDIVNHQNWTSAAPTDPNRFYNQDNVTFGNSANLGVNISGANVLPGSVTFNNDATHNYTISSTGGFGIADAGNNTGLTLNGVGSVTLNTLNAYAGATTVHAGTLIIDVTGAIAGSTLTVDAGAAATVNAGGSVTTTASTINGTVTVGGTFAGATLALASPGTVTVTSAGMLNTTTLNVASGTATVQSGGTLASPTVNINGGSVTVQTGGFLSSTAVTVASGAALTVQAGGSITAAPALTNNGAVTFNSDQIIGALSGTDPTATLSETGTLTVSATGSYAGIIQDDGPGGLTVSAGTLTLTGANLYTGATTINTGATLSVDTGANTGSLSAATAINIAGTLIYGRTGTQVLSNTLSGGGAFRQVGGGTMTLTADNSGFTGAIQSYSGTILQNSATSLGTGAGGFVLGTPQPAGAAADTATGNITLIAAVPATSIGSISSTSGSTSATPTPNVLTVPAGVTLTDTGAITVGPGGATSGVRTTLAVTGGGALVVSGGGAINVAPQANNISVLDLSGLNSVTVNTTGAVNIANGAGLQGAVLLANTTVSNVAPVNSITASAINMATSGTNNPGDTSFLTLGTGANSLFASSFNLGTGRGSAVIQFPAGAPATASITIADSTGLGPATMILCNANTNGTQGGTGSFLNLAGFQANVSLSTLTMAQEAGNLAGGAIAGITFDTGTFAVTGAVTLAADTSGSSTTGPTATLTVGGAAPNTTATGAFSAAGIVLGNFTNANTFSVASAVATATFTINGGTASITGSISNHSTQGTTVATLNLLSGTLDMNGSPIGGGGGVNSGDGPITVNFPTAGQAATLANLGGGGINGAGITMSSGGTVTLVGASTAYTGPTTVTGGTLRVGDGGTTGTLSLDPVTVSAPGVLTFNHSDTVALSNAIGGNGTVNQVGSGALNVSGVQAWSNGATLNAAAGATSLQSDAGSETNYALAVNVTPSAGSATLHIATNASDGMHLRNLRVNAVGAGGAGLVIIDAATTGAAPNPKTGFGAIGGSVATYLGNGAGGSGFASRATVENLWKSAALEGYWALQNHVVIAITRGLTLDPAIVTDTTKNGLVVIPSTDNSNNSATYVGEDITGDTNGDGKVDINDLGFVLQHLGTVAGTLPGEGGGVGDPVHYTIYTPAEGDVNGDLVTNISDLGIVLGALNQSYSPAASGGGVAAVPEPASMLLIGLGAAALLRRRRR